MSEPRPPVRIVPCSGATVPARLAQEAAAKLKEQAAGTIEARVVAVDGCETACASRGLEARGVDAVAVGLHEIGAGPGAPLDDVARGLLLERIAGRLHGPRPNLRSRAREPLGPVHDTILEPGERGHTTDDYLLIAYGLTCAVVTCGALASDLPTRAAHVARALGISRPTAGAMLARLEDDGLVQRGPSREIVLTPAGHAAAVSVVRRQRVLERLVVDVLGYGPEESYARASQIRAGFDDAMIERIASTLAPPARCPHGWPLDVAREQEMLEGAVALSALPPKVAGVVVALPEHDAVQLERLAVLGLAPGADVEVLAEDDRALTVALGDRRATIDRRDARAVLVSADGPRS